MNMEPEPINIILKYFPRISLPPDPETPELSEASSSDSDVVDMVDRCELQTDSNSSISTEDEPMLIPGLNCITDQNQIDNHVLEPTGIDAFENHYGLQEVQDTFNKIDKYPPENMMHLLHTYQQELDKTTNRVLRGILKKEINQLEAQILCQELIYKQHLISVILHCPPEENRMKIQRRKLLEFLTLDQLADIIFAMKDMKSVIQERSKFKEIINKMNVSFNNRNVSRLFKAIGNKKLKENTWDYVQTLLMPMSVESEEGECEFCLRQLMPIEKRVQCSICLTYPKQYLIKDCGHYYLCEECKQMIENSDQPKCAMCRKDITQFIKVFED